MLSTQDSREPIRSQDSLAKNISVSSLKQKPREDLRKLKVKKNLNKPIEQEQLAISPIPSQSPSPDPPVKKERVPISFKNPYDMTKNIKNLERMKKR